MAEDRKELSEARIEPSILGLAGIPPTDPAIIKAMLDTHLTTIHYAAVGRVAAAWSVFEGTIDHWAIINAGISAHVGICFTAQIMGASRKLDAYIALARLLGARESSIHSLMKITQRTYDYGEKRNRVVHDPWYFEDASMPVRLEATAKKELRLLDVPVPTEEVSRLAAIIEAHCAEFWALAEEISNELRPSPERSLPGALPEGNCSPRVEQRFHR
jgi:hypothetical protein